MKELITKEIITYALISCSLKKVISPQIISNELSMDIKNAHKIIDELINQKLISGYDKNKKVNLLISISKFEEYFSFLSEEDKKSITKDFCFYNDNVNFFTGELDVEQPLNEELKNKALEFIKKENAISPASLQRKLKVGFSNACKIIDWLLEQKLIKKTNTYEVIKNKE